MGCEIRLFHLFQREFGIFANAENFQNAQKHRENSCEWIFGAITAFGLDQHFPKNVSIFLKFFINLVKSIISDN